MATTLQAPIGASSVSHQGEEYKIGEDGLVTVPDPLAKVLLGSHGFVKQGQTPKTLVPAAKDEDLVEDDDTDAPSPEDFSRPMTQQQMKQYLKSEGVGIPKGVTVGALRKLVEATYAETLKNHKHDEPTEENTKPTSTMPLGSDTKVATPGMGLDPKTAPGQVA